jgi:hypothetical protein
MYVTGLTTVALLLFITTNTVHETALLHALYQDGKISAREHTIFKQQLDFKTAIGTDKRLDSLTAWNLDVVYIEAVNFYKKDSILIKEYYFSSKKLDAITQAEDVYQPEKYYENGRPVSRYFFKDEAGKEHLQSILKHMQRKKKIDFITPIEKIEVLHAGCGITWLIMQEEEQKAKKKYRKAMTPEYYLTEILIQNGVKTVSFQRPVKSRVKPIVEGHSF